MNVVVVMYAVRAPIRCASLERATLRRSRRRDSSSSVAACRASAKSERGESQTTVSASSKKPLGELVKSSVAFGGLFASAALQAVFPEHAHALSIRDPVFGDIEVWQFLVLTAGYFIFIEIYLDNKYDESKKPIMPSVQKKKEEAKADE